MPLSLALVYKTHTVLTGVSGAISMLNPSAVPALICLALTPLTPALTRENFLQLMARLILRQEDAAQKCVKFLLLWRICPYKPKLIVGYKYLYLLP